jgi:hypothetical protein
MLAGRIRNTRVHSQSQMQEGYLRACRLEEYTLLASALRTTDPLTSQYIISSTHLYHNEDGKHSSLRLRKMSQSIAMFPFETRANPRLLCC